VDFLQIENDLKEINKNHPMMELAFDPREATYLINNVMEWIGTNGKGESRCIEITQGPALMSEPMKELEALIYSRGLRFDGDPVLTWMIGNVVKKQGRNSGPVKYYYPTKERDGSKIDGAVALIMAIGRAMLEHDTLSVYEGKTVAEIKSRMAF
jgi:phage terminase large subunit-like protein